MITRFQSPVYQKHPRQHEDQGKKNEKSWYWSQLVKAWLETPRKKEGLKRQRKKKKKRRIS